MCAAGVDLGVDCMEYYGNASEGLRGAVVVLDALVQPIGPQRSRRWEQDILPPRIHIFATV
eukprot:1333094-Amorphochlora_amoeboformis.AAC.2